MMKGGGSPQLKALRKYMKKRLSKSPTVDEDQPHSSLEQSEQERTKQAFNQSSQLV